MHDVSLRSSTNLMDAHNLAIVLCPNLVSGSSPAKDIAMCNLPGGPVLHPGHSASPPTQGHTTLSMIVKLCIQRYYEIFDEVQDRSEALPPARSFREDEVASSGSSSPRTAGFPVGNGTKRLSALSHGFDDDDSIDDTMLVMCVDSTAGAPPSTWGPNAAFRGRPRSEMSPASRAAGPGQLHPARSTIGIEKIGGGTIRGKGSVSIGRGSVRKAGGAGVEALGVTASGFFAPPLPPKEESKGG